VCRVSTTKGNDRREKEIYADYNGRRIYFCCPGCIGAFKKDPAKYLKKVDAEIEKAKDAAAAAAKTGG